MSIKSKIKTFFFLDDEYDFKEEEMEQEDFEPIKLQKQTAQKQNVVSLQSVQKSSKVVLVEPRVYAEAQDIADHLKKSQSSRCKFTKNRTRSGKKNCRFFKRDCICNWRRYPKNWNEHFSLYA